MGILLDLVKELGIEPKWEAATEGGEYKSPCPLCGGDNRFRIQPNREMEKCTGFYACRQCGIKGDTIQFCREILGLDWKQAVERSNAQIQFISKPVFRKPKDSKIIPPSDKWQEKAASFVDWAHREIQKRPDILDWLEKRGIPIEAVNRYKIGYSENPKTKYGNFSIPPSQFGLPDRKKDDGTPKPIWIPKGIVIPTVEPSGSVIRIKVRRTDYKPADDLPKYIAITGSMQGLNIVGDRTKEVMIVVESELDAYALHYAVQDIACVVSVGSNTKNPDNFTDHLAKNKPFLLICHDNDDGGKAMLDKWKGLYSHARACPTRTGKDIGEAIQNGEDLAAWIKKSIEGSYTGVVGK